MAVTPRGIVAPNLPDPYNLVGDLNTLAQTADAAIGGVANAHKGTSSQRTAFTTTAVNGMLWQDTDGIKMLWRKDGSAWVPAVWRWAGTSAQMNAFTQAPAGFEWYDTSVGVSKTRFGNEWVNLTSTLSGALTFQTTAGGAVSQTISFPIGFFQLSPIVQLTGRTGITSSTGMHFWVSGAPTTTSATISVDRATSTSQIIYWTALPRRS